MPCHSRGSLYTYSYHDAQIASEAIAQVIKAYIPEEDWPSDLRKIKPNKGGNQFSLSEEQASAFLKAMHLYSQYPQDVSKLRPQAIQAIVEYVQQAITKTSGFEQNLLSRLYEHVKLKQHRDILELLKASIAPVNPETLKRKFVTILFMNQEEAEQAIRDLLRMFPNIPHQEILQVKLMRSGHWSIGLGTEQQEHIEALYARVWDSPRSNNEEFNERSKNETNSRPTKTESQSPPMQQKDNAVPVNSITKVELESVLVGKGRLEKGGITGDAYLDKRGFLIIPAAGYNAKIAIQAALQSCGQVSSSISGRAEKDFVGINPNQFLKLQAYFPRFMPKPYQESNQYTSKQKYSASPTGFFATNTSESPMNFSSCNPPNSSFK